MGTESTNDGEAKPLEMEIDPPKESNNTENRKPQNAVAFSRDLLKVYYNRLFPFEIVHQWFSYGEQKIFNRREFSFTIKSSAGDEIYIRYQSFQDKQELTQAIQKKCPDKIDIGAIFSHSPCDKNAIPAGKFQPCSRELVFDIDLTDYDSVRHCGCSGANICHVCWKFMRMAVKVMDEGLREDFGFEHIGWFYSGRRGIHCWVCDESARSLSDQERGAIASYFSVDTGTDKNKEMNLPIPLHPMMSRAVNALEPMFIEDILPEEGHGLLASEENWSKLLDELPEGASSVKENLSKSWSKKSKSPKEKWDELKTHMAALCKVNRKNPKTAKTMSSKERNRLENWATEVIFRHGYPQLDIEVSKKRNHLLKSPFCVHPKTGRVCVPINDIDSFDPFAVPTLPELIKELDQYKGDDNAKVPDWSKTRLREYFEPMMQNFLGPLAKASRERIRDEKDKQAAISGEF